jgi:ATP-binding cassette subfamily B (MDR/TAP) protein 1
MRQEIAFFDRGEHSSGSLTTMLSSEATAMAGLSGVNLGSMLTILINLGSGTILGYSPFPNMAYSFRICFIWKLGLVSVALLPITVTAGYLRFALLNKLNVNLHLAYEKSANIACEQVAAIRTVASLNREIALHEEYVASLNAPVRQAFIGTLKNSAVQPPALAFLSNANDLVVCFRSVVGVLYEFSCLLVWE